MNMQPASARDEFSRTDLMREAVERCLRMEIALDPAQMSDAPLFAGTLMAEEVQPGLLATGHDITYSQDESIDVHVGPSITFGVLLSGGEGPLEIAGHGPVTQEQGRPSLIAFGAPAICRRSWRKGQRSQAIGFTLQPEFFSRFGETVNEDGLATLSRLLEGDFQSVSLPKSERLLSAARKNLENPYTGPLRHIFLESNTLSLIVETAQLLEKEHLLVDKLGRRHYEQVMHAREILDASLADPPKTLDLAAQVGVNVTTLRINFRAAFGTTIFGYVRDRRLQMARLLILEHGLKVSEAGYRVGFSNAAAFTAAYRRHFGHPPTREPEMPSH